MSTENNEQFASIPIREMMLYKWDRTLAVLGLIALGLGSLWVGTPEAIQIATAAVGGLVGYVGGRSGK